jgi:hypothetical protein
MKRCIRIPAGARKELERRFGVSDTFVYDALAYKQNGDTAQRIRQAAVEMGGLYIDPDFVPSCKTEYLDGQIRQTFSCGVVLTIDRSTGKAVITVGDEVVRREDEPVRMSRWNILAQEAQQLAIQRVINA